MYLRTLICTSIQSHVHTTHKHLPCRELHVAYLEDHRPVKDTFAGAAATRNSVNTNNANEKTHTDVPNISKSL